MFELLFILFGVGFKIRVWIPVNYGMNIDLISISFIYKVYRQRNILFVNAELANYYVSERRKIQSIDMQVLRFETQRIWEYRSYNKVSWSTFAKMGLLSFASAGLKNDIKTREDCLCWAFGNSVPDHIKHLPQRWNSRHSDIFIMRETDEIYKSLRKVAKAYLEYTQRDF